MKPCLPPRVPVKWTLQIMEFHHRGNPCIRWTIIHSHFLITVFAKLVLPRIESARPTRNISESRNFFTRNDCAYTYVIRKNNRLFPFETTLEGTIRYCAACNQMRLENRSVYTGVNCRGAFLGRRCALCNSPAVLVAASHLAAVRM